MKINILAPPINTSDDIKSNNGRLLGKENPVRVIERIKTGAEENNSPKMIAISKFRSSFPKEVKFFGWYKEKKKKIGILIINPNPMKRNNPDEKAYISINVPRRISRLEYAASIMKIASIIK